MAGGDLSQGRGFQRIACCVAVNALSSGNVDNLRYGSGGVTGMRSLALPPTKQLSADWAKGMVAKTGFTNLSAAVPFTRTSTQ